MCLSAPATPSCESFVATQLLSSEAASRAVLITLASAVQGERELISPCEHQKITPPKHNSQIKVLGNVYRYLWRGDKRKRTWKFFGWKRGSQMRRMWASRMGFFGGPQIATKATVMEASSPLARSGCERKR